MSGICLDVVVRENTGTGSAREARRNGNVPAVIYGGGKDSVAVSLRHNEVLKALNAGQLIASMIEISHEGNKQKVITKDVQFHPVTDAPVHIDLYRVDEKSIIDVEVGVTFIGDEVSPGIKTGGTLNVVRYTIEVSCPAVSIPDTITVDISEMDVGDSIHISEITLPEGVTPTITDRDFTIATIVASRAAIEEEEEGEGEEGLEGAEGEEGEDAEAPEGGDE
ncbi:MAG: 50S ribosomal protein L25/general stress protein Ctc [Hellea sp.]|nr:50S ribosomal protein L25/general stress protein Ctc [Hellea sp.]